MHNCKLKMVDSASDAAVTFKHQKCSIVQNHFERKNHSICKHCGKRLAYYGGTRNLCSYFKNAYPSEWPTADSGDKEGKTPAGTKSIKFFYTMEKSRRVCSNAKSKAITNLIIDWISENSQLISIIEDTGFKRMFAYIEPGYRIQVGHR